MKNKEGYKKFFSFIWLFFKKRYFSIFIFVFLFFYCFLVLRKVGWTQGVINHTDFFFPFRMQENFTRIFSSWSDSLLGRDYSGMFMMYTSGIIIYLLQLVFSYEIGSRILYLLPLILIFLAAYKLIHYLLKDKPHQKAASFLGAYFAICNSAVLNDMLLGTYNIILGLAFIIFAFYLLIRGLEEKKIIYGFYLGAVSLFFFHITSLILFFVLASLFSIFFILFKKRGELKFIIKFSLIALLIAFLVNAYWLLPYSTKVFSGRFVEETFSGGRDISILQGSTQFAKLHSISRMISYYDPQKMFVFNGPAEIIAGFLFLLFIFLPFYRKKIDFYSFFFILCALFFLILSLGVNKTFGGLFRFLWDHTPFFHGFRTTRRFLHLVMISYMSILSFFVVWASELINKFFKKAKIFISSFYVLIFLIISFISWPFFSGNLLGLALPLEIPDSYFDIVNQQGQDKFYSNLLILPRGDYPFFEWMQKKAERKLYSNYTERMMDYVFEIHYFYKKPPITLFAYSYNPIIDKLFTLIDLNFSAMQKILSLFNIKDILVHKDYYINDEVGLLNSQKFQDNLNNSALKIKDNEQFSYYSLLPDNILPKIYVPSSINTFMDKKVDPHFFYLLANLIEKKLNIAFTTNEKTIDLFKNFNLVYPILFDYFDNVKVAAGLLEVPLNVTAPGKYALGKINQGQLYEIFYRFTESGLELLLNKGGSNIEVNGTSLVAKTTESKEFKLPLKTRSPLMLVFREEEYYLDSNNSNWTEIAGGEVDLSNLEEDLMFYSKETAKEDFNLLNSKNGYAINLHDCSGQPGGIFSWQFVNKDKKEFWVESQKGNACFALNIGTISKDKISTLSFDYSVISGNAPNICVSESNLNKCLPIKALLKNSPGEWVSYRTNFMLDDDYTIYPHFYHSPSVDAAEKSVPIKVQYKDVKMEKFGFYKNIKIKEIIEQGSSADREENVVDLVQGINIIKFLSPDIDGVNLIPDGGFEEEGGIEEKWAPLHSCSGEKKGKPDYYLEKVNDSYEGEKALLIASKTQNACISPIIPIEPGYKYLFSFNYKILSGNRPVINLNNGATSLPAADFPALDQLAKNQWYYYETLIEPEPGDTILYPHFNHIPINGEETKIIYDNVKILKIPASLIQSYFLKSVEEKQGQQPVSINFKQLGTTKYKVAVLGAKESFPLVLSESFHPSWKLYIKKSDDVLAGQQVLLDEPIKNSFPVSQNQQYLFDATNEERASYQKAGLLAYTGPDFISQSLYGVIQNENIPSGSLSETWLSKLRKNYIQLPDGEHFEANGFANAWFIDLKKLEDQGIIKKNQQGFYNFELVIEYWPQRLFILGLAISILSLFSIIIFIVLRKIRKKRKNYVDY